MKINSLTPELIVGDLNGSLKFYESIGFSAVYRRDNPPFVFLELGESQIMLQQILDKNAWEIERPEYPFGRGINFQILVPDVNEFAIRAKKINAYIIENTDINIYQILNGAAKQKELVIADPDGYVLRFSEKIS